MLSRYLNQILTMDILADSISIIDDKGIVRYFQAYRKEHVPFFPKDVVGKHYMDVFPNIDAEKSTVLKALKGETIYNSLAHYTDATGQPADTLECIYPIKLRDRIIGVACIARSLHTNGRGITLTPMDLPDSDAGIDRIIGHSSSIQYLKMQIKKLSQTNANVLIYGETGTGKELVAQALHASDSSEKKLFFSQNCAAIPEALLEGIFFGTVKGIYTGAINRTGILEQANGGTLFLDEINSLALSIQAKLLKALEEKKFRPLGSNTEKNVDFRIIAATNEPPFECIKNGKLREDLFFRIGTVILEIPPLRNRSEDIPDLVHYFIKESNTQNHIPVTDIADEALDILIKYQWPGNVRELKNVLESSMIFATDGIIRSNNLPQYILENASGYTAAVPPPNVLSPGSDSTKNSLSAILGTDNTDFTEKTLNDWEAEIIKKHLELSSNHTLIAKKLAITRQTLLSKIKKYHLS